MDVWETQNTDAVCHSFRQRHWCVTERNLDSFSTLVDGKVTPFVLQKEDIRVSPTNFGHNV
jgi:hypothetical protein